MFYSQCLLSKKGPLGTIWVAAHCHKRLKKEQVKQTNISSSVDRILLYEVPVVTYRILAYLLLGVVRIYSKKVEYLFIDSRDVLNEIQHFVVNKKANAPVETMCAPYSSITLPGTFELDAFDLEACEGASSGHVKPCEEIMLEDAWENGGIGHHSFDKYHCEEDAARFEACSSDYTPIKDIRSPYLMNDAMLVCPSHDLSNVEASMEKLRGKSFSLEERLDPMILGEAKEEPDLVRPFDKEHQTNEEQKNSRGSEMIFGMDEEPPGVIKSFDKQQHMDAEQIQFSETTALESEKLQTTSENRRVSITIDVTPESKVLNASGAATSEFMALLTPATKERARVSRKRKCLFDDIIVLPNKVLKHCINDSSDLVCKRRKAPHTALLSRKACQISNLRQSFLEQWIPCISLDLKSLVLQKKLDTSEPVGIVETPASIDELGSPTIHMSPDQPTIAPSTPVTQSTSLRYGEIRGGAKLDRAGPSISFESIERELSPSWNQEIDIGLMDEELSSCAGDSQEKHNAEKWSGRTRIVARYLHKDFLTRKKQKDDEVLNLSQVLKGKAKKQSARVFYELLVLTSGEYVDVKQDNAYDDIFVLETPKLKQACETNVA